MTQYLIVQGADVNEIFECKRTLLQIACEHNSVIAVRHLINVNENSNVNSLLCCACRCGDIDLIKLLLEHGADVNYSSRYSYRTLLSTACQYKQSLEIIGMLIDVGAEVNPNIRHTPLMSSIDNNDCEIFNYLLKRGAHIFDDVNGVNLLLYFCERTKQDNISMLTAIINAGADVNCVDSRGVTPLIWACVRGLYEITFKLLQCGAQVNVKFENGRSALGEINYNNIKSYKTREKLKKLLKRYGAK